MCLFQLAHRSSFDIAAYRIEKIIEKNGGLTHSVCGSSLAMNKIFFDHSVVHCLCLLTDRNCRSTTHRTRYYCFRPRDISRRSVHSRYDGSQWLIQISSVTRTCLFLSIHTFHDLKPSYHFYKFPAGTLAGKLNLNVLHQFAGPFLLLCCLHNHSVTSCLVGQLQSSASE